MNYSFSKWIMGRVPSWPAESVHLTLEEALSDIIFRNALKLASNSFYEALCRKEFNPSLMNRKEISVLRKYINRICLRPTPFGLFAGYGLIKWGGKSELNVAHGKLGLIHDFALCYKEIRQTCIDLQKLEIFSNPTAFKKGGLWRYYRRSVNEESTSFEQCSCPDLPPLSKVMSFCRAPVRYEKLLTLLEKYSNERQEAEDYIRSLVEWDILLTELEPNVTGEIYHHRMDRLLSRKSADPYTEYIIKELENDSDWYSIYSPGLSGSIEKGAQDKISKSLELCLKLKTNSDPAALIAFRKNFINRFDREMIPLMQALDHIVGVDYDSLGDQPFPDLADDLNVTPNPAKQITHNESYALIANKLLGQQAGYSLPLELNTEDLETVVPPSRPTTPGIGVLFKMIDGQIIIDQAGGITGTSLAGRFTLFDDNLLEVLRGVAREEEKVNPGVLFAEIAWYNDDHAANINMRKHIRKYEIPIMTTPVSGVNKVHLQDLWVFVEDDQVILFSAKHNKRIIPVLSTAYNFRRSDLPVFRFLCDLQYQGVDSQHLPDLEEIVPGLDFYPRLVIEGVIIALARWLISKEDILLLSSGKLSFDRLVIKYNLPMCFSFRKHDQEIVFDRSNQHSEEEFVLAVKGTAHVWLREFLPPQQPVCRDKKGAGYYPQFLAFLINKTQTYLPVKQKLPTLVKRRFAPLEKWSYYKFYCHPLAVQEILTRYIYPSLIIQQNSVSRWFFIRYNDPDHHLRVRILGDLNSGKNILKTVCKKLLTNGYCSSIQIDTYKREMERYQGECIEEAEHVFSESSVSYCSYLLRHDFDPDGLVNYALYTIKGIINASDMDTQVKVEFCKKYKDRYIKEFGGKKELKIELDKKIRTHRNWHLESNEEWMSEGFHESLILYFTKVRHIDKERLPVIVASIIHMQANRCFVSKQRMNEMAVYAILEKYYQSVLMRSSSE